MSKSQLVEVLADYMMAHRATKYARDKGMVDRATFIRQYQRRSQESLVAAFSYHEVAAWILTASSASPAPSYSL